MVEQSFWEMLRTKRDSLTKSGIIVADYLLQHAEGRTIPVHLVAGEGLRRGGGYDFPILPLAGV